MFARVSHCLLVLLAAAPLTACLSGGSSSGTLGQDRAAAKNKGSSLMADEDARGAYERALLDFRRGDCLGALPVFKEIRTEFPYSRFSALSELRIGDCQFKNEEYPEAISTFRQFVRIRPSHKEIPYARFKIAEAYYQQLPGGWFMTPPEHERDQSAARDALIQLRRFVVDFPEDPRVPEAQRLMEECMSMLAEHELYVARFYLKRDAYRGAAARLRGLLASYPGSGAEPEALLLLGRVYLQLEEVESARQTFDELVERFPETNEATKARGFLGRMAQG